MFICDCIDIKIDVSRYKQKDGCASICKCVYMYIHRYIDIYTYMYMYMYMYMYVYVFLYVLTQAHVYKMLNSMCIYIYCIYIRMPSKMRERRGNMCI